MQQVINCWLSGQSVTNCLVGRGYAAQGDEWNIVTVKDGTIQTDFGAAMVVNMLRLPNRSICSTFSHGKRGRRDPANQVLC